MIERVWHFEPTVGEPGQYDVCENWRELEDGVSSRCFLMQYTELKDKNGREIYEGDIVRNMTETGRTMWQIAYRTDPEFVGFLPYEITFMENKSYQPLSRFVRWDSLEIIGNIHENPELLA